MSVGEGQAATALSIRHCGLPYKSIPTRWTVECPSLSRLGRKHCGGSPHEDCCSTGMAGSCAHTRNFLYRYRRYVHYISPGGSWLQEVGLFSQGLGRPAFAHYSLSTGIEPGSRVVAYQHSPVLQSSKAKLLMATKSPGIYY